MTPMLETERLRFAYKTKTNAAKPLLAGLSIHVHPGEFVSVIGASGCGKSTLFKLIAGLLEPDSGTIRLNGKPAEQRLGRVGYMPQKDLLLPWRTVLDNCLLPLEVAGKKNREETERVRALLARLGLADYERDYPDALSGGMRQRAAMARTLAAKQELLLLDEPFGALDAMTKRNMHKWLLELWEGLGSTVLLITHDLEEAILLSDRIYLLDERFDNGVCELQVELPRPRHYQMNYDPLFTGMRQRLEQLLDEQTAYR